jgi:hypothetical protein
MLPDRMRTIIEEPRFVFELQALISNAKRADEFVDAAKWVLSRDPSKGRQIGRSHVWFLPIEDVPGILPVVLYYTFDDDFVNFLSIQETVYPPKDC